MVILTLGAFRFSGLQSDVGSLPLNIESGAIFDAVDTIRKYVFNGSAWVEFVAGTGEVNEMANVGVGTGLIFRDKLGVTFNIKSLIGGTNVVVTDNADDITISTTGSSPLTTKGDLFAFSTVDTRLPVGIDGQILSSNSAIGIGLEWIDDVKEVFTWTANHDANGFALEDSKFADGTDPTKILALDLLNMTTAITLTLQTAQSTIQTLLIPNITQADTLVTENFPQTLFSKTLDAPILDLPTIADYTNATHDHLTTVGGGLLAGVYSGITGLGVQVQTLDMGNGNDITFTDGIETLTLREINGSVLSLETTDITTSFQVVNTGGDLGLLAGNSGVLIIADIDLAGNFQIRSDILSAEDIGSLPVLQLQSRISNDVGPITVRPIFEIQNQNTPVFTFRAEGLGATFYDNFVDFDAQIVPANPATGIRRLFADSTNGDAISVRTAGGATVSLEAIATGSQTPWLSDINANGFDLRDLSNLEFRLTTGAPASGVLNIHADGGGINVNVPTGNTFDIFVQGVSQYEFSGTRANFFGNDLIQMGILSFEDLDTSIQQSGNFLQLDVAIAGTLELRFNNLANYTFDETALNLVGGKNLAIKAGAGTGFIDMGEITTPIDPSAFTGRLYVKDDSSVTTLFFRDNAGNETNLLAEGGGGTVTWLVAKFSNETIGALQTHYWPVAGFSKDSSLNGTDETQFDFLTPNSGTWERLSVVLGLNTGGEATIVSRINFSTGNQIVTYATTVAGEVQDTSNTDTLSNLDNIDLEIDRPLTPSGNMEGFGWSSQIS